MLRAIRKKKVTLEDIAEMLTKGFASMHAHFDRIDEIFDRIESHGKRTNEGPSQISRGAKEVVHNDI